MEQMIGPLNGTGFSDAEQDRVSSHSQLLLSVVPLQFPVAVSVFLNVSQCHFLVLSVSVSLFLSLFIIYLYQARR